MVMRVSAFADVTATCGLDAICYARNDLPTPQSVRVMVEILHFATGTRTPVTTLQISLAAGGGTTIFFCADGKAVTGTHQPTFFPTATGG